MNDQQLVFALIATLFVFFAYNRFRYDVVAFGALAIASIIGVVPKEEVFSGFGHPAVVIVALVLVVGRGLVYAGVVELITQNLSKFITIIINIFFWIKMIKFAKMTLFSSVSAVRL